MSGSTTIVVGGGSSGGVIASRLTEDPAQQAILVEAGPDYPEALPERLADAWNPQLEGHDWGLEAYFVEPPDSREPMPYPRGRVMGGSSAVNGSVAQRPIPEDFDAWAALGNSEWGWDQVLPYIKAVEADLDYGSADYHGDSGPVPIIRLHRDKWPPSLQAFEQACREHGIPECADINAPDAKGVGPIPRNHRGDLRASTLVAYVNDARDRENLTIRDQTMVRRVIFDGTRAVGVEVERDGEVEQIEGDRVVLSAGAINTPQILMLSGVGPKSELKRLGVETLVDSPGVGQNLIDHPFIPLVGLPSDRSTRLHGFRLGLTRSSGHGTRNDISVLGALLEVTSLNFEVDTDSPDAVMILTLLAKPRSRGAMRLSSDDPKAAPELRMKFLSDPLDMQRMMEAFRVTYEIATSRTVREELPEIIFPSSEFTEDDALREWLHGNVTTGFHGSGTCRMGPEDDPQAVVSQRLAVRGIEQLFVADASVMPEITNGYTNIACYTLGERVAEWLKSREPAAKAGA